MVRNAVQGPYRTRRACSALLHNGKIRKHHTHPSGVLLGAKGFRAYPFPIRNSQFRDPAFRIPEDRIH